MYRSKNNFGTTSARFETSPTFGATKSGSYFLTIAMSKDEAVYEKYMKHVRGYFAAVGFLYAGALLMNALSGDPIPKYLLINGLVLYVTVTLANHFYLKYQAKKNASS